MSPQYDLNQQTQQGEANPTSPWTETFHFCMDMSAQPEQRTMDTQHAWSDEVSPTHEALSVIYNQGY